MEHRGTRKVAGGTPKGTARFSVNRATSVNGERTDAASRSVSTRSTVRWLPTTPRMPQALAPVALDQALGRRNGRLVGCVTPTAVRNTLPATGASLSNRAGSPSPCDPMATSGTRRRWNRPMAQSRSSVRTETTPGSVPRPNGRWLNQSATVTLKIDTRPWEPVAGGIRAVLAQRSVVDQWGSTIAVRTIVNSPRNMIFDEWGSSPAVGAGRSVRTPVRYGVHGRRGAAEDSMATQGKFVHRPGAFLPIRERLLTGVNECSREGGGSGAAVRHGPSDAARVELDSGKRYPVGDSRSAPQNGLHGVSTHFLRTSDGQRNDEGKAMDDGLAVVATAICALSWSGASAAHRATKCSRISHRREALG